MDQFDETFENAAETSFEEAPAAYTEPEADAPAAQQKKSRGGFFKGALAVVLAAALIAGSCFATASFLNARWEDRTEELVEQLVGSYEDQLEDMEQRMEQISVNAAGISVSGSENAGVNGGMTPAQVYASNVDSVVLVYSQVTTSVFGQSTTGTSTGSGFILTEDGYIVTNCHVVEGGSAFAVVTSDGLQREATLVGFDQTNDVALLKVEAEGLRAVRLGSSDALIVGDQVVAIGNPLGELTSTLTVGYVSAKERDVTTSGNSINMIQTDAAINSGNSGGPLFNMNGEVVGITTAKYSGTSSSGASIEGIGFAIPIDDVSMMFTDLIEYGYITSAYLGVSVLNVNPTTIAYYGVPADAPKGTYVAEVVDGFCAKTAGVQAGDVIIHLGEYDVDGISELSRALRKLEAGQTTTIVVWRAGEEISFTITLDEKPQEQAEPEPTFPEGMPEEGSFEEWFEYFAPFFGENGGN